MSDPNALLESIRHAIKYRDDECCSPEEKLDDLTGMVEELDRWLSSGAFHPTVWNERTARYENALRRIRERFLPGCQMFSGTEPGEPKNCIEAWGASDDGWCDACIATSVLPPISDDPWQSPTTALKGKEPF